MFQLDSIRGNEKKKFNFFFGALDDGGWLELVSPCQVYFLECSKCVASVQLFFFFVF